MTRPIVDYLWIAAFGLFATFAVPWFLWGNATVWAGLPLWLWWHVGWMLAASAAFYAFTLGAWDRLMDGDAGEVR